MLLRLLLNQHNRMLQYWMMCENR